MILVKFEILNPKISKFEILNPNTKISNLDTKFLNVGDFCYKFEETFTEIDKIGDISKFEVLNPKIQNLTKSQILRISLTLKSKIFDFDKIWPKIKIPPRWFIITLRFWQIYSKVKIFDFAILTNLFESQNLKSLTLTQKFPIWTQNFWMLVIFVTNFKFEETFTEIDKIGDISKFEILNPKIQSLRSLTLKSKIFNFDKIWQKSKFRHGGLL